MQKKQETIEKMNKAKSWFFEMINKIDKIISQTHQETEGEKSSLQN